MQPVIPSNVLIRTMSELVKLTNDPTARRAITADNITAVSLFRDRGESKVLIAYHEEPLRPGTTIATVDYAMHNGPFLPVTSFFLAGDKQFLGLGLPADELPANLLTETARPLLHFLATREGVHMNAARGTGDMLFVGETRATLCAQNGCFFTPSHITVLAFSPEHQVFLARTSTGSLVMQFMHAFPQIRRVDTLDAWIQLRGIGSDHDVYRIGRPVERGEELIAPMTSLVNGISLHGELTINVRNRSAVLAHVSDPAFVITGACVNASVKRDAPPTFVLVTQTDDHLDVVLTDSPHGYDAYARSYEALHLY